MQIPQPTTCLPVNPAAGDQPVDTPSTSRPGGVTTDQLIAAGAARRDAHRRLAVAMVAYERAVATDRPQGSPATLEAIRDASAELGAAQAAAVFVDAALSGDDSITSLPDGWRMITAWSLPPGEARFAIVTLPEHRAVVVRHLGLPSVEREWGVYAVRCHLEGREVSDSELVEIEASADHREGGDTASPPSDPGQETGDGVSPVSVGATIVSAESPRATKQPPAPADVLGIGVTADHPVEEQERMHWRHRRGLALRLAMAIDDLRDVAFRMAARLRPLRDALDGDALGTLDSVLAEAAKTVEDTEARAAGVHAEERFLDAAAVAAGAPLECEETLDPLGVAGLKQRAEQEHRVQRLMDLRREAGELLHKIRV